MQIELKNIKHAAFASQETNCFEATIYVDGRKAGSARNEGQGGSTFIEPRSLEQQLNDYAKTLPKTVTDFPDPQDKSKRFEYEQSAETLIDDLLVEWLLRRDLKRLLKKKVVYTKKGMPGVFSTKALKPNEMAWYLADLQLPVPKATVKLGADKVLNLLSENEAFALYRNHG